MPRNRIIYNSQALYCSQVDSISSQLPSGTVQQLYRVQSFDESFDLNYTDVVQFGNLYPIDRLLLENPVIEGGFSYYLGDGLNEKLLGFDIANTQNPELVSCISGILLKKSDHKNYYLSIVDGAIDANSQEQLFLNTGVVAIGNAFIKNYKMEAGVGSIPIVNVDIQGLNLQIYNKLQNQNPLPSIDISTDTLVKDKFYTIPAGKTNKYTDQLSALNPGDIIFQIPDPLGFDSNDLKIQNVTLDINLDRGQIQKIGSKYAISRELNFPIIATLDIDADAGDLTSGNLNQIFCSKPTNDFSIIFNKSSCNVDKSPAITYFFKDARLISESFSSSFGSNSSINLKYEVQLDSPNNLNRGVFMSGSYITPTYLSELIFTPTNIPYLVSWYSSDYGVYNTVDNLATENQSVAIWKNKITNGPDISAPLNFQPNFSGGAVAFTLDMMSGYNTVPLNAPLNYYIATKTPLSGINNFNVILKQGGAIPSAATRYSFVADTTGRLGVTNPTYTTTNITMSTGKNIIACIFSDTSNAIVRKNNTSESLIMSTASNSLSQFVIGSNSSTAISRPIAGSIYEILIYTGLAHNTDQQNQIINYLSQKWAIDL